MKKLHLGCGKRFLPDHIHIDYSDYPHIDYKLPVYPLSFIEDDSIDEIYSSHTLEYFDFNQVGNVLKDWYRCLKANGILRLSVPDFNKLLRVYANKDDDIESIIGPLFGRWDTGDNNIIYHKTVYNRKKIISVLSDVGFTNITEWDPITHFGIGKGSFDDYSKAFYPHMDFAKGFPISLNILATK